MTGVQTCALPIYKPALDGIGYQDLTQEQMVGETSVYNGGATINKIKHLAANKTVAWIDYMTIYNRTFGDFAAGETLDFMVLNRRYEVGNDNTIKDLTTYIDPQKYIEIFADTSIDSQNFWVQTVVQATRRGNYSAKQIPLFYKCSVLCKSVKMFLLKTPISYFTISINVHYYICNGLFDRATRKRFRHTYRLRSFSSLSIIESPALTVPPTSFACLS